MNEILKLVEQHIREKQAAKTWIAGKDFVNYAGSYFDEKEFVAGVESLLKGWLVMGDAGLKFEREFPKYFGNLADAQSCANSMRMIIAAHPRPDRPTLRDFRQVEWLRSGCICNGRGEPERASTRSRLFRYRKSLSVLSCPRRKDSRKPILSVRSQGDLHP